MSYGAQINPNELETFKAQWPCHGLPDSLYRIWFGFDTNGDLNDVVARARNGRRLDTKKFDGPALVALSEDAQRKVRPEHANLRFGART